MIINTTEFEQYSLSTNPRPLFLLGDACDILKSIPTASIDFCMTSPPYWKKRVYQNGGIGLEATMQDYVLQLMNVFLEVKRVLKNTGSFWLNLGDTYRDKGLAGIPWRIALASGAAFLFAQLMDVAMFNRLRQQSWWKAPLIGSLVASVVDTAVFFFLAFAGSGMDWLQLAVGDLAVKAAMAALLLVPYRALLPRLQAWSEPALAGTGQPARLP